MTTSNRCKWKPNHRRRNNLFRHSYKVLFLAVGIFLVYSKFHFYFSYVHIAFCLLWLQIMRYKLAESCLFSTDHLQLLASFVMCFLLSHSWLVDVGCTYPQGEWEEACDCRESCRSDECATCTRKMIGWVSAMELHEWIVGGLNYTEMFEKSKFSWKWMGHRMH